jgi:deoxyribodipyrimidine photo-lyase
LAQKKIKGLSMLSTPIRTQVVWFKRDLRNEDHAPLANASKIGPVVPLYIVEPAYWLLPDTSRRHWHFIHDSLTDLNEALTTHGAPLIIRVDDAISVLEELRQQLGVFTLWSHEETGNDWTYQRDKQVALWCKTHHIEWHETPTNGVVRRLTSRDNWLKLRNARMAMPLIAAPTLKPVNAIACTPLPDKNHALFGSESIGNVQVGGRQAALKTLASFLQERARHYLLTLSKPGASARHCSRLSAHLTYGNLSIREVLQATEAKIASLKGDPGVEAKIFRKNLNAFLARLAWHCHFIQKLEQQPEIEFVCIHSAFEGMREPRFRQDFFTAWENGQTGYPLVDACMRSLKRNGWINFRMRAMLVSFASYDLWLDWRQTAPVLARLFTDYEAGIHYPQFQMQSGVTGINAVRIYNPIKQSYEHDPEGRFIRRYVPELKDIPLTYLHEPWQLLEPPKNYPAPIVDHEVMMRFARKEISQQWQQSGFKEEAKAIKQKIGSRKQKNNKKKHRDPAEDLQMGFRFEDDKP